jgi:hypothetical protein
MENNTNPRHSSTAAMMSKCFCRCLSIIAFIAITGSSLELLKTTTVGKFR